MISRKKKRKAKGKVKAKVKTKKKRIVKVKRKPQPKTEKASFGESELIDTVWTTMLEQAEDNPALTLLYERMQGQLKLIGLTGGIGSGKSTLSAHVRSLGIPVIDADAIAREIVDEGTPALQALVNAFGAEILNSDGTLNRSLMADIVFQDPDKRRRLEEITHPEILRHIGDQIRTLRHKQNPKLIVIEAPLLFESGLYENMDLNILITVPEDIRLQRLKERGDLSETEAHQRMRSQMTDEEKEKLADFIIDNSGNLESSCQGITEILRAI